MGVLERFNLKGRVALVTGGAGEQFGGSISDGLAEAGATVIVASRSLAKCEAFADGLRRNGFDAYALRVDVLDPGSITALREEVLRRFERLDVLVNSAVTLKVGAFEEQTPDDWLYAAKGAMVGVMAA